MNITGHSYYCTSFYKIEVLPYNKERWIETSISHPFLPNMFVQFFNIYSPHTTTKSFLNNVSPSPIS